VVFNSKKRAADFAQRSLTENRFWLRIMKEHALFLSEGFNRRDTKLIAEANRFFQLFHKLLTEAMQFKNPSDETMLKFNQSAIRSVTEFRNFKQELLTQIILCRISGFNLPLLVDHIRREAEFFVTVLTRLNEGIDEPIAAEIVRENVFWLRIMADHSRFIHSLLDPSERKLVQKTQEFAQEFDQLLAQARDLDSMIKGASPVLVVVGGHFLDRPTILRLNQEADREKESRSLLEVPPPALQRFNQEAIAAAREIHDFKATALVLLRQCKALSMINPLLADHVTREAEKFISVLTDLERRLERKAPNVQAIEITQPAPPGNH
jgi:hypothetical protein